MSGSTYQQMSIFADIINNQTQATISAVGIGNNFENIVEKLTNSYTEKMQTAIDDYNKAAGVQPPTDQSKNDMESASLLFNQLQTQMQSSLTITNSSSQKQTSYISTLQSDQQNTLTSTSYLSMIMQYLTALLK